MRLENENDYAKKGVAGAGLGVGIAGTALGLLNGGLGNLGFGLGGRPYSTDDVPVNRYEAAKDARIAALETEVKLRDANTYTDQKLLEVYKYFEGKIGCIENSINAQAVYNATNTATINCISGQVAQLMALTKVVIPTSSICPEPMARYNSWVAPTATTTT
jgi:hypothetical protein